MKSDRDARKAAQTETHATVETVIGGTRVVVTLREQSPGSDDWRPRELKILADSGSALTSSGVARLPLASLMRKAAAEVRATRVTSALFAAPSDPPPSFTVDGRGAEARTDADWARLAFLYWSAGEDDDGRRARRDLAKVWTARYPTVSEKTWRNRIAHAKQTHLVHDDEGWHLTPAARRLLGIEETASAIEFDVDGAEVYLRRRSEEATPTERVEAAREDERHRRIGYDPAELRARAALRVAEFYGTSNPSKPIYKTT